MNLYDFFEYLKHALHLPEELELRWLPGKGGKYRGMVSKDCRTIFIFDEDEEDARETAVHEAVEVLIVRLAQLITNPTLAREERELYNLKEAVVEVIRKLVTEEQIVKRGSVNEIVKRLRELGGTDYIE